MDSSHPRWVDLAGRFPRLRLEPYPARIDGFIRTDATFEASPLAALEGLNGLESHVVLECVKCSGLTALIPCYNCGGTSFGFAPIAGDEDGIACKKCNIGWPRWTCGSCNATGRKSVV